MQFNPTIRLSRFLGSRDGRRIPGRLPQEQLVSDLGPVLDLSAGGMRVLCTRPRLGRIDVGEDLATMLSRISSDHRARSEI